MSDLRDKIKEGHSPFQQTITDLLPGFRGYLERETRRDADKLLRDHLAAQLETLQEGFQRARQELTNQLKIEQLDELERASRRLETLTDRLRYAPRGYSGFFDAIKIEADTLDAVYEQDAALASQVEPMQQAVETVVEAAQRGGDLREALAAVGVQLDRWDAALQRREQILSGIEG